MEMTNGNTRAAELAKDASENNFSSRRGVYFDEASGAICFYNNNPYSNPLQRDIEIAAIRMWLRENSLRELGAGCFPPKDAAEDPGYTFAMLIEADRFQVEWMAKAFEVITSASLKVWEAGSHN